MFNEGAQCLKEAKHYRNQVNNRIESIEKSSLLLSSLQANTRALISALEAISAQYNDTRCDDVRDRKAFEQMIIVGKAMMSLLQVEVGDASTDPQHLTNWEKEQ